MNQPPPRSGFNPDSPISVCRAPGVRITQAPSRDEAPEYFLKLADGGLLKFGEEEGFLWELLDGERSFRAIEHAFRERFGLELSVADFLDFLDSLLSAGALVALQENDREILGNPEPPRRKRIELASATSNPEQSSVAAPDRGRTASRPKRIKDLLLVPMSRSLGDWQVFFDAAARVIWPVRFVFWLTIPAVIAGLLISIKHSDQLVADWSRLTGGIWWLAWMWVAEHFVAGIGKICEGVAIAGFGGTVSPVRIHLVIGYFIRLKVDEEPGLSRRQRLWIVAALLWIRALLFGFFSVAWIELRVSHPAMADVAFYGAWMGFMSFFWCAVPCVPLYGYKFLSILLNQENLYARAFTLLSLKLRGRPAPYTMTISERWGLLIIGIGTAVITSVWISSTIYQTNYWIIRNFNGLGFWLALGLLACIAFYFYTVWKLAARIRAMQRAPRLLTASRNNPS